MRDLPALRGYRLGQELARDERFVLYRARREHEQEREHEHERGRERDRASVLVKLSLQVPESEADVAALKREFELLGSLPLEAIARAHEWVQAQGRSAIVFEDRGGSTLAALGLERPIPLGWALDCAIQLVAVLAELHRSGVVHRGIRPQAVLIEGPARRVRLADFSDATRGAAEAGVALAPRLYGSRLAYAAPEQTGRIGQGCDHRSDFYSLGVVLYKLLTGRLPFETSDALELMHSHVARLPTAPVDLSATVPPPLSQMVMKLLAKAPGDRYQSASCLQRDLQRCSEEWHRHGRVLPFAIALRDVPEQFVVPQRLYGRDAERACLQAAFDRARRGRAGILLVAGYSGVGKTTLIQHLHEPVARVMANFVSGKFDQVSRDAPYRALIQALRQLVQRLLAEPQARLAAWRHRLENALGDNAAVVCALIPGLSLVLGEPVPLLPLSLPPAESRNRLALAFQSLFAGLATAEHPLVVFLDDLQWVDAASLQLLELLFASPALRHLLLVGAYRDNEVDPSHPLLPAIARIEEGGVSVERIALAPLGLGALTQLTADTLQVLPAEAEPLAALLLDKTAGNPFFAIQFLMTLHQDGLIRFDAEQSSWGCQLDRVAAAATTDNVVDLMSRKIERLAPVTQGVLTLAACVGHRFEARTLAVVSEQSLEATMSDLAEAAIEGLIVAEADNAYVFLHDRVQQAAYARIALEQRPRIHLSVGRLLWAQWSSEPGDEALFEVASHLIIGAALIESGAERLSVARLALNGGQRAKRGSAYRSALAYFNAGIDLLDKAHWRSQHALAFELWFEAASCEYLCGQFDAAEIRFATLLEQAARPLERARVHGLRMVQLENMGRYADALASAREGLAPFGVTLPEEVAAKQAALEREVAAIEAAIGTRPVESLIDLPTMSDAGVRMVMSILNDIWSAVYIQGDATLARLISAMLVRLSLEHGNCEESAYGYVTHAITVGPVRQDYAAAFAFGTLALQVNQRFDDRRHRAKIYQQFHAHVNLWSRPMHSCIAYAQQACRAGLAGGDFLYAAYAASTQSWPAIVSCQNLDQCVRDLEPNLALIARLNNTPFADALGLVMSWARALQGQTAAPLSLSHTGGTSGTSEGLGVGFDEAAYVDAYSGNPFFTMFHAIARLHLCYLLEELPQAMVALRAVRDTAHQLTGMIWSVLFDFWGSLTLAAQFEQAADDTERDTWLADMRRAQASLDLLARSCAENFLCHSLLLGAELKRLAGRQDAAIDLYERAIAYADETATVQHQALANELYAKFWLRRGNRAIAGLYLRAASAHYTTWGAQAKLDQMQQRHADLLGAPPPRAQPESVDLASIVKAAHATAEWMEPEHLLERLLGIAIENACAQRGLLIEDSDNGLGIFAEGLADGGAVRLLHDTPLLADGAWCSRAMVDYVQRTSSSLVLGDATLDERFAQDAYVRTARPLSVLCLPIVHQGQVSAILYLENRLASNTFGPQRIELIQLLMAQGAISLANARLSQRMREEMGERQRAEDTLRAIEAGTAAVTGAEFFRALVRNLARALRVRYAFVAECFVAEGSGRVAARSRAFWKHGDFGADFEFEVPGTPCQAVLEGQTCHHASDLQALFPADVGLVAWDAKSYLGMPLLDSRGEVIGHMAILDSRPMPDVSTARSVMRLCAGRAGAELERLKAAEGLQRALAEVEELKNRLEEENVYLRRELIANVSHDLRSPLAALRGYLETLLLKDEVLAPAERRHYLEIAQRQAGHLQALISELFELARLDFQGYRIEHEPVQLGELARDVVQKFQLAAQTRQVDLRAEIEPGLGLVRADIGLIERTLSNLLENALAHTPAQGGVVLSVQGHGHRLTLRVSDNGSGIPDADLPRIFERFYRGDKARSPDNAGTGLGLAIVKRIVELHDSKIEVTSEPGRGTAFWFDLPLM